MPNFIVPDNLKSAVIKNNKPGIVINQTYEDFAEHYDVAIDPARPYQPRDKGIVESAVKEIQRRILAPLRNIKFFSINELNQAIEPLLDEFNKRETKRYPNGHYQKFINIEKDLLKPLPKIKYIIPDDWQHNNTKGLSRSI